MNEPCPRCQLSRRAIGDGYEFLHGRTPVEPHKWPKIREWMKEAAEGMARCACPWACAEADAEFDRREEALLA